MVEVMLSKEYRIRSIAYGVWSMIAVWSLPLFAQTLPNTLQVTESINFNVNRLNNFHSPLNITAIQKPIVATVQLPGSKTAKTHQFKI